MSATELSRGAELVQTVARRLIRAGYASNGLGGLLLFVFLIFLFPDTISESESDVLTKRGIVAFGVFAAVALPLGRILTGRDFFRTAAWLQEGRAADTDEQLRTLRYPLRFSLTAGLFWLLGAVVAWPIAVDMGADVAGVISLAVLLSGVTACALEYLLVERIIRPMTAIALAEGQPPEARLPGVSARMTMAWVMATGVPVLALGGIGLWYLLGADMEVREVVGSAVFLAGLALVVGLLTLRIAARSVADPLARMREALEQVERGRFDARVSVDDGSEVGRLQAGFNRMAAGLGERERLREAFGAYVDPELTEKVLEEGTDLEGEEVDVSILFMDVRGFTSYSESAEARDVVSRLNELFDRVVPVISRHGGHANKFIGDGLLAVFGAPARLEDHADRAVGAALEIARVVAEGDFRVGVGVHSGSVMAGTIGGGGRLDFTVIGDTVNTASRVESATRETGDDVLITKATLELLDGGRDGWVRRDDVALKGKASPVALYAPG